MKAVIICAQGMEECEGLIVYDLLYRAGIKTDLAGLNETVISSHELSFKPTLTIDEINKEEYDCLILPGGMPGTKNLENDKRVIDLIEYFVKEDRYIAAICAAPSILNHLNLLKEEKFVCFPGHECNLKPASGKVYRDNKIITGKGLGAAFEFAYEIIKVLDSEEKAKEVLAKIQY